MSALVALTYNLILIGGTAWLVNTGWSPAWFFLTAAFLVYPSQKGAKA